MTNFRDMLGFATFYRRHLLDDVMPFWVPRTIDRQFGGYLTCFDRRGNSTDTDKYIWFQGRQLWMFSALYQQLEPQPAWLELARVGRDFIIRHAYAGGGRWNYQLDRAGGLKRGTISIFTDLFVLGGLCEYSVAAGRDDDLRLIGETYDAIERNVYDPQFKDIFHGTWSLRFKRHGIYMIALGKAGIARQVLGEERTRPLIDHCLHEILHVFARDEQQALFESVARDGTLIDDDEGRVLNPGHALESMWFCIEEGQHRGDRAIIDRAIEIIDWMYKRGYDRQFGGIVAFLDANGLDPKQMDWHKETNLQWCDKPWWVHSEALYALALAAVESGRRDMWDGFIQLHDWCQRYFADHEFGEWYPELYRDGRAKLTDKGTPWKAAYHLPRALLKLSLLFKAAANRIAPLETANCSSNPSDKTATK
jgi:N-acylglucosamine 2-epimerase